MNLDIIHLKHLELLLARGLAGVMIPEGVAINESHTSPCQRLTDTLFSSELNILAPSTTLTFHFS